MKFKNILTIVLVLFLSGILNGADFKKRPRELQFYVNSYLTATTIIEYNPEGDVSKMSSFENSKLTDYAKYKYDSDKRLSFEKNFDSSGILIKTRKYICDDSGVVTEEKVFSPEGKLIEYLVMSYSNKKLIKVEYFKPDNTLFQIIEFKYNNKILYAVTFNKIGKYLMVMKAVYDKDMRLIGHNIKHSNADVKIETRYIYEDGYATDYALQLIFR